MRHSCPVNIHRLTKPEANPGQSALATAARYGDKKDVAAMLGLSRRSVDNLMAKGCPYLALGKRRCRFDMAEVRAWLADNFHVQRRASRGGVS